MGQTFMRSMRENIGYNAIKKGNTVVLFKGKAYILLSHKRICDSIQVIKKF